MNYSLQMIETKNVSISTRLRNRVKTIYVTGVRTRLHHQ